MIIINIFQIYGTIGLKDDGFASTIAKMGKSMRESETEMQKQGKTVSEVRSEIMKLAHAYESQGMTKSDAMKKANADLREEMEKAKKSTDGLGNSTRETGDDADKAKSQFAGFSGILDKYGGVVAGIGKAAVAGLGAAATAFSAFAIQSVKAYADYEQLIGGVETLFGESADAVEKYAESAYKTANLSANQYLKTITSFSASLIKGLGGDTKKAAEIGNIAVTDMADNANKMGTSIEAIQNAYQGFAKDNFTMLDNLKLGYGGTAGEMARLVNDSGVLGTSFKATAENVKNIPFDQLVLAIHKVQTEMGITGTTAIEASATISGSWNTLKSSWENVLTSIASGNKDFVDKSITALASSTGDFATNAAKAITNVINNITDALPKLFAALEPLIPLLFDTLLPAVAEGTGKLMAGLVKAIIDNLPMIRNAAWKIIVAIADGIDDIIPILKPVTSAISLFANNLETINAVLAPVVAAFVAFKAAMLITNVIEGFKLAMAGYTAIATAAGTATAGTTAGVWLYNAAQKASAIATGVASAALTAKKVIVGILTGEITFATVAQWLWNAAMAANPIGLVVAAIGLLIGAIILSVKHIQSQVKETQVLIDTNKEFIKSLESAQSAREENLRQIELEADAAMNLANQVAALSEKENKSIAEKQELAAMVNILNESCEGLNLEYDLEKDLLSQTTEEIYKHIDALRASIKARAAQEQAVEIAKEQLAIERQIAEIEEERAKLHERRKNWLFGETPASVVAITMKIGDLNKQEKELCETYEKNEKAFDSLTDTVVQGMNEQAEAADNLNSGINSIEDSYDSLAKAASDMFKRINTESEISLEEMIINLSDNQNAIANWSKNIELLARRGIDEGLLQSLKDAGPEAAGYVAEIAKGTDAELQTLSRLYAQSGDVATKALSTSFKQPSVVNSGAEMVNNIADGVRNNKSLNKATTALIDEAESAARNQVTSKKFPELGKQIIDGMTKGVSSGKTSFSDALVDAAKSAYNATKEALGIKSPSRLFMGIGENIDKGLINGVLGMSGAVDKAVDSVFGGLGGNIDYGSNFSINGGVENRSASNASTVQAAPLPNVVQHISLNLNLSDVDDIVKIKNIFENYSQQQLIHGGL